MSRFFRLFLWLLVLGILLAGGLFLGDRVQADPGYVLLAFGGYTVEMSMWTFLIVFLTGSVALWVPFGLGAVVGRTPWLMWRAFRIMGKRRADSRLVEGALWLRRDNPSKALDVLRRESETESLPALHWLLASEAARRLERIEDSDTYLKTAEAMMTNVPKEIPISLAPTNFKALVKSLKKNWREDWAMLLETTGDHEPLERLAILNGLLGNHSNSFALALVQTRLALSCELEAEARHHIERAATMDPAHPLVLTLMAESQHGCSPSLELLRRRLIENGV